MNKTTLVGLTVGLLSAVSSAHAVRDQINIVGSSTVYPFATVVAERFGRTSDFGTPKIEATGTGGGMKLFCKGVGVRHPDITNASRRIKKSELEDCRENGVTEIVEVLVGYDGIVLANAKKAERLELSLRDVYLALAKRVPDPDGGEKLVDNPYEKWSDFNPDLPAVKIEVLGPPPTSGTRDAFNELAIEGGCKTFDWIRAIKAQDSNRYERICRTVREDGAFVEAGENDNLIVQKLDANPDAVGVFGFSFLDQNRDKVQGSLVDGYAPTFENIAAGDYAVSRPLYIYAKKAHIGNVPGIEEFLHEFVSPRAAGENGYLVDRGLIPLPRDEYARVRKTVKNLEPLDL
jgi:phosphate transport system substrate-binding protein